MIVVSDTSAITSLIQIDRLDLLAEMFGTVAIPEAVEHELRASHPAFPHFIQVQKVADIATVRRLNLEIDRGEAEAIVLAKEINADTLLMDEKMGRAVALREGIPVIGLVGVLVTAKRAGVISAVGPVLAELEDKAHFHIADGLKSQALRSVGE